MNEKEKIEKKIEEIQKKLELVENSCSALQKEEWESLEFERQYLKILKEKLKNFN